ncbi:hypothetical protein, partial [Escherichia coli]|uniref:hypothetical protein n=1 Tax=Escherichia coli TaxID=562 RepID=UPI00201023E9
MLKSQGGLIQDFFVKMSDLGGKVIALTLANEVLQKEMEDTATKVAKAFDLNSKLQAEVDKLKNEGKKKKKKL